MTQRTRTLWTFAITSAALFIVVLDTLVVTTALPTIQRSLGRGIEDLEWTVNAYTLTFAVLLLTGAALGDKFGRRRMFTIGLGIFTLASAAAGVAPWAAGVGLARRAAPSRAARRAVALGAWGGIAGLAVAFGPLVGGAVVDGISWHWIF